MLAASSKSPWSIGEQCPPTEGWAFHLNFYTGMAINESAWRRSIHLRQNNNVATVRVAEQC